MKNRVWELWLAKDTAEGPSQASGFCHKNLGLGFRSPSNRGRCHLRRDSNSDSSAPVRTENRQKLAVTVRLPCCMPWDCGGVSFLHGFSRRKETTARCVLTLHKMPQPQNLFGCSARYQPDMACCLPRQGGHCTDSYSTCLFRKGRCEASQCLSCCWRAGFAGPQLMMAVACQAQGRASSSLQCPMQRFLSPMIFSMPCLALM